MRRRRFLSVTVAGAGLVAGCSSGSDTGSETRSASTAGTDTPSVTPTATTTDADSTGTPTPNVIDRLPALPGTWSTYCGSQDRTSSNPSGSLPSEPPTRRWEIAIGPVPSQPLVSDGVVYAATTAGALYALEGTTGDVLWQYETGVDDDDQWSPTLDGSRIYLVDGKRRLHCVDIGDGTRVWRRTIPASEADASAVLQYHASPAVLDGTVYLAEFPNRLVGFDADSGEVNERQLPVSLPPYPTVAVADGALYVSGGVVYPGGPNKVTEQLAKLRPGTDQGWTYQHEEPSEIKGGTRRPPVVTSDAVINTGPVYAAVAERSDGSHRWRKVPGVDVGGAAVSAHNWHQPAVAGDDLVFTSGSHSDQFAFATSVDPGTGEGNWGVGSDPVEETDSSPVVLGDAAVFASGGKLYAHALDDGRQLWVTEQDVSARSMVAVDGAILVGEGGTLSAWA